MSETATMLALPRPPASGSSPDDSFTALMHAVLDSARTSGSLESSASLSTSASDSTGTTASVPELAPSDSTVSSAASSTTPSPCPSILRSSASNLTLPSRTGSPSISFAPLPRIEPRKRNSPHPLGVAARSRLLRHRRMLREHGLNPDEVPYQYGPGTGVMGGSGAVVVDMPGGGTWEEIRDAQAGVDAEEEARADVARGGHPRTRAMSDPSEEDALLQLGRLVKGAGKSLWRSISMKDMRGKDGARPGAASDPPPPLPELPHPPVEEKVPSPQKTDVHVCEVEERRPPSSSEDSVREEAADVDSSKKLFPSPPPPPPDEIPRRSDTPRKSLERRKSGKRVNKAESFAAEFAGTIR